MTLHELRVEAMRQRATIYHTMRLSHDDSVDLATGMYLTLMGVQPSLKDFCIGLQNRTIPDENGLTFRGMQIEWFCDGPTEFVLESYIYN